MTPLELARELQLIAEVSRRNNYWDAGSEERQRLVVRALCTQAAADEYLPKASLSEVLERADELYAQLAGGEGER